jgi:Short C-terminal domain/Phospholipase_D-nuclease N-terminal
VLPSKSTTLKELRVLASSYPFLDVFWTMMVFFLWVLWLWILFTVFADVFRRDDLSGWGKAGWIIFTIVLPYLGVFIYLITQSKGMTQRNLERARAQRAQFDDYVRSTAGGGGAAAEIERAKALLDSGAIDQADFEAIKRKALA